MTYRGARSARIMFHDVVTGKRIMALVCSDTGFGKTLEAKRALRANNMPFHEFGVTPNERDLVKLMWSITSGVIKYKGRLSAWSSRMTRMASLAVKRSLTI